MKREVILSPEATNDLQNIYDFADRRFERKDGLAFVERIAAHCDGFVDFPERGTRRDKWRPGLRTTSFERKVTIVFRVLSDQVIIDRILYGGQDLEGILARQD